MKWCNCKQCGGTDEFAMCENAMMNGWVDYHKTKARRDFLLLLLVIILIILFFI